MSTFPVPQHLSEQARAILSEPLGERTPLPALDDTKAWLQTVANGDAWFGELLEKAAPPAHITERRIADVGVFEVRADGARAEGPLCLDFHGGALIHGGGRLAGWASAGGSDKSALTHWGVDYRMPPLHPFPAGLHDALAVYRAALEQRSPAQIVVWGSSAGGNIAAALLLAAREAGLPMPGALVLLSPEVDLTESGDSFQTLAAVDNTLRSLLTINRLYAGDVALDDPLVSPLFGDLTGFPPTFLQTGTRDLFLSNTIRMHRALRDAGVDASLHVFEAMPHGRFGDAPEEEGLTREIRAFLRQWV